MDDLCVEVCFLALSRWKSFMTMNDEFGESFLKSGRGWIFFSHDELLWEGTVYFVRCTKRHVHLKKIKRSVIKGAQEIS